MRPLRAPFNGAQMVAGLPIGPKIKVQQEGLRPISEPRGRGGRSRHAMRPNPTVGGPPREDPNRSAVFPGRLIQGPFGPPTPGFRRPSYNSDAPLNLALSPRVRPATESEGRAGVSRFRECPNRPADRQSGPPDSGAFRPNRASFSPTFVHFRRAPA